MVAAPKQVESPSLGEIRAMLAEVREVWLVVQDRYIAELPRDWRFPILWAYVLLGRFLHFALKSPVPRPNGHWLERSGVLLTEDDARGEVRGKGKGWVGRPIPFGSCMPLETSAYGRLIFDDEKVTKAYEKREFDHLNLPRRRFRKDFERLTDSVKSLKKTASEL